MIKKTPFNYSNDMDRRRQGLDAIVENLLPDVTTDDAGKIAKVGEDGKWTLADGSAQTMTVAITYDSEQDEYSADKTHSEIIAAIAAGVIVMATYNNRTFVYAGKNQPAAFDAVYFSYLQADSDNQFIGKIFEIDEDDRITYSEHDLNNENVLPAVTSSDNGKVLTVINGVWAPHFFNDAALLWESSEVVSGEYVSNSDGHIITDSTGARSPFVEVVQDKVTIFAASEWNNIYNCWYDENNNFISSFSLSRGGTDFGKLEVVNKPSNAKYLCLSNSVATMPNIRAWDGDITT